MRLLGLDTSTRATSVAACDGAGAVEARDDPRPGERPGHARRLLPLAADALERRGWEWGDVERIVVGRGPGTFTGLRIGIATARGLASSLGVPLVGVSSLEALAIPALRAQPACALAMIDARRGEVFLAGWSTEDGRRRCLAPPQVVAPGRLADVLSRLPRPLAVGDGALNWREALERAGASVPGEDSELHRVSAAAHCQLAREAPEAAPEDVRPEYLRLPDAEIARRAVHPDGS